MPIPMQIWSEAWARATREELGLVLTCTNPDLCISRLHASRPDTCREYTVTRTPDLNTIIICKPHVTMLDPDVARELGLAPDDVTPDLED